MEIAGYEIETGILVPALVIAIIMALMIIFTPLNVMLGKASIITKILVFILLIPISYFIVGHFARKE